MLREVLTVSALILAVLLVRAIFKNRVPKRMVYTLWLVVLVKLCLPGTLVSLPVLPAEEAAAPGAARGAARAASPGAAACAGCDAAADTCAAASLPAPGARKRPQSR